MGLRPYLGLLSLSLLVRPDQHIISENYFLCSCFRLNDPMDGEALTSNLIRACITQEKMRGRQGAREVDV